MAELLPATGELRPVGSLQGLAVGRPRIISDPGAKPFLQQAQTRFGPGHYEIVMFFPQAIEDWMVNGIAENARKKGLDPSSLARFDGSYRLLGGNLVLDVTEAVTSDGNSIPFDVRFSFREHRRRK
jgi:hypothetical protein